MTTEIKYYKRRSDSFIDAVYFDETPETLDTLRQWGAQVLRLNDANQYCPAGVLKLNTLEGWLPIHLDGVICRGTSGEFYCSTRAAFEKNWKEVMVTDRSGMKGSTETITYAEALRYFRSVEYLNENAMQALLGEVDRLKLLAAAAPSEEVAAARDILRSEVIQALAAENDQLRADLRQALLSAE